MDKAQAKAVMVEAQSALDAVFAKHGLKTKKVSATYDAGLISLRITAHSTDPDLDPKVTDWKRYAESYGLPLDALGKTITVRSRVSGSTAYLITGLAPTRNRYPVCVYEVATGKAMLLTVVAVKDALGIPVEPWERSIR